MILKIGPWALNLKTDLSIFSDLLEIKAIKGRFSKMLPEIEIFLW